MSYRIKTVAEMTGIARNTILAWERRYALFAPNRTSGGYRDFSDEDVALLRRLKVLLNQGYKISEAISLVRDAKNERDPNADLRERLLAALLAYDRPAADRLRGEMSTLSFRSQLDLVLLPLLGLVGDGWATGEISVAAEHFVAAWCREQMITMFHSLDGGPETGPEAICAGYPGEDHELGLLAVGIKLALAGFRVNYLGTNLPLSELVQLVRERRCRLICQSLVGQKDPGAVRRYLHELRRAVPPETLIAVGGAAVTDLSELPGIVICDDVNDIIAAMRSTVADA